QAVELGGLIDEYKRQFRNPRRRLRWALVKVRAARAMNGSLRSVISAGVYIGLVWFGYRFGPLIEHFFDKLFEGQPLAYLKLFGALLLIEILKGKLIEKPIEKRMRSWEARTTDREIGVLCVIDVH